MVKLNIVKKMGSISICEGDLQPMLFGKALGADFGPSDLGSGLM